MMISNILKESPTEAVDEPVKDVVVEVPSKEETFVYVLVKISLFVWAFKDNKLKKKNENRKNIFRIFLIIIYLFYHKNKYIN